MAHRDTSTAHRTPGISSARRPSKLLSAMVTPRLGTTIGIQLTVEVITTRESI